MIELTLNRNIIASMLPVVMQSHITDDMSVVRTAFEKHAQWRVEVTAYHDGWFDISSYAWFSGVESDQRGWVLAASMMSDGLHLILDLERCIKTAKWRSTSRNGGKLEDSNTVEAQREDRKNKAHTRSNLAPFTPPRLPGE